MITRIVRLTFKPEKVGEFQKIFHAGKDTIRQFHGCKYLSLHQDHQKANVFYTVSHWECPEDLESYRSSDFFQDTWSKTKLLFSDKPLAYSLEKLSEL